MCHASYTDPLETEENGTSTPLNSYGNELPRTIRALHPVLGFIKMISLLFLLLSSPFSAAEEGRRPERTALPSSLRRRRLIPRSIWSRFPVRFPAAAPSRHRQPAPFSPGKAHPPVPGAAGPGRLPVTGWRGPVLGNGPSEGLGAERVSRPVLPGPRGRPLWTGTPPGIRTGPARGQPPLPGGTGPCRRRSPSGPGRGLGDRLAGLEGGAGGSGAGGAAAGV